MFLCHFIEANYLNDGCFGSQNPLCLALAFCQLMLRFYVKFAFNNFKVHPFYINFDFTFYNTFEK